MQASIRLDKAIGIWDKRSSIGEGQIPIAELCVGAILGLTSSIPVGPINLTIVATALRENIRRSAAMALTVALIDGIYAFIAASTISLPHWSIPVSRYGGLLGALIVIGFGFYLISRDRRIPAAMKPVQSASHRELSLGALTGVVLYVSNPTFMVFWISAVGASRVWFPAAVGWNRYLFGAGVILGTSTWFGFLLYLIRHRSMPALPELARRLSVIAGWLLIAFGSGTLIIDFRRIL